MILHILVGDLIIERFPTKTKWLKLILYADENKEFAIHSDQFFGENTVRFNQTVHCPVDDIESVITKVSFVVQAVQFDGTSATIGSSSLLCSSMEQPTTKSIVMHNKLEAYVGRLTVTVFHNESAIELGDEILTKHNNYQPNMKEYAFLLSRRQHRAHTGNINLAYQPISFNSTLEDSVNKNINGQKETHAFLHRMQQKNKMKPPSQLSAPLRSSHVDNAKHHVFTSKIYERENGKHAIVLPMNQQSSTPHRVTRSKSLTRKPPVTSPYNAKLSIKRSANTTKRGRGYKEEPKLRPTAMSVGYVHNQWPNAEDAKVKHEKTMYSLFLAEERRLALLREVNEEVKYRNQLRRQRIEAAQAKRALTAASDSHLQGVLETKEGEIKRLRNQLNHLMSTKQQYAYSENQSGQQTVNSYQQRQERSTNRSFKNTAGRRSSSAPVYTPHYRARTLTRHIQEGHPYSPRPRSISASRSSFTRSPTVSLPSRSPSSQLNHENSMALRLLQRDLSKKNQRAEAFSPNVHRMSTRAPEASTASLLKSHAVRRKSANSAVRKSEGLYRAGTESTFYRSRSVDMSRTRTTGHDGKITVGTGNVSFSGGNPMSTTNVNAYQSGGESSGQHAYQHRIPTARPASAPSMNRSSGDWLASARASVNQLHTEDFTRLLRDGRRKPLTDTGLTASGKKRVSVTKTKKSATRRQKEGAVSPYSIIEDMERTYPHRKFESPNERLYSYSDSSNSDDDDARSDTNSVSLDLIEDSSESSSEDVTSHSRHHGGEEHTQKDNSRPGPVVSRSTEFERPPSRKPQQIAADHQFSLQHSIVDQQGKPTPHRGLSAISGSNEAVPGFLASFVGDSTRRDYGQYGSQLDDSSRFDELQQQAERMTLSPQKQQQQPKPDDRGKSLYQLQQLIDSHRAELAHHVDSDEDTVDRGHESGRGGGGRPDTFKYNFTIPPQESGDQHQNNRNYAKTADRKASGHNLSSAAQRQLEKNRQFSLPPADYPPNSLKLSDSLKREYTIRPAAGVSASGNTLRHASCEEEELFHRDSVADAQMEMEVSSQYQRLKESKRHSPLMMLSHGEKEKLIQSQFEKNRQFAVVGGAPSGADAEAVPEHSVAMARTSHPSPQVMSRKLRDVDRGIESLEKRLQQYASGNDKQVSEFSPSRSYRYYDSKLDSSSSSESSGSGYGRILKRNEERQKVHQQQQNQHSSVNGDDRSPVSRSLFDDDSLNNPNDVTVEDVGHSDSDLNSIGSGSF